jgi:hypothetical protein
MRDLAKILHIVFGEHFTILLFLSFSWLFIYVIVSLSDWIAAKILLRLPFYLRIYLSRRRLGLPNWRTAIGSSALTFGAVPTMPTSEVGKLYSSIDYKISEIRSGRHWVTRVLSNKSIDTELDNITSGEWMLLESDSALSEATSPDPKISETGILSSIGNREVSQKELLGVLFHGLRVGPPSVKKIALFHLSRKITSRIELQALESIVNALPTPFEQLGDQTLSQIREQLLCKHPKTRAIDR